MDIVLISQRMTEDVENMTIPELKAVLAKYSLETTGKRADLVSRLSNYFKHKDEKVKDVPKSAKASPKIVAKSPKLGPKSAKPAPSVTTESATEVEVGSSPKSEEEDPKSPQKQSNVTENPKKEVTELTMEERLALRAKRFNLETKVETSKKPKKLVLNEDLEVLKKRSERFGIPLVTEKSDEKKEKNKFDFVVDEEELLRRKKRLERFST